MGNVNTWVNVHLKSEFLCAKAETRIVRVDVGHLNAVLNPLQDV